ncbi:MAG TPA: aminotransferase class III-fold pyridoxal phosphate-dependent enzyme [Methylocella sp.]|nr:aminotransferase class III-fold pyridoxal phosphate-dependent enzyme [Methylocella sp.]
MAFNSIVVIILSAAALTLAAAKLRQRLLLSKAKHPSLAGHARMARRVASLVPFYEYDEEVFFRADSPPEEIARRRADGFVRLSQLYKEKFPQTTRLTEKTRDVISDLQFTEAYRVPFQFANTVRKYLPVGAFMESSAGVTLADLDGNVFYDLTGSYGVNVFGYDFYKDCIEEGERRARALGPVLGSYHPLTAINVQWLKAISGQDEVSFHMSGTEAVMQAVRLARYHSGRKKLVRFTGAYHGWWGDVQPGIGNPLPADHTYTLKEMSDDTLRVLRGRRDIACVLVNPLQALHVNSGPPGDSSLVDSSRRAGFDKEAYRAWLRRLRAVCTERNIILIFDEVFSGFRFAHGGAQEYFGIHADLVTYGKTLGGGLPIGAVCGRRDLMKRYKEDRPADICFARGTFNSHPYVMAAMHAFLTRLEGPSVKDIYSQLDLVWDNRAVKFNGYLQEAGLPLRIAHMSSIWSVIYTQPSRYNWVLQYYLRAEGLALSWTGTGRLIFSLNYTDEDFAEVTRRFMAAAKSMQEDGWWWLDPSLTNKSIKRQILGEMIAQRLKRILLRTRTRAG